jgi:uncharacterized protein YjeT (DUF2065 family)
LKLLITLLGLILVLEGLPYATSPEAMQKWLRQLLEMPPTSLRIMGFWAIAAGLILCFLTQRTGLFG